MVGGDRLDITLTAAEGADVLVTTPGAAKWYRTIAGPAAQNLATHLASDAVFQLVPQPTIVFDGADVRLNTQHRIQLGARFVAWDILALGGRHQQALVSGRLRARTDVFIGTSLQYHEGMAFAAADPFTASPLGLGGAGVVATFLASAPAIDAAMLAAARATRAPDGLRHAATILPGAQPLLVIRALGTCADAAFRWFSDLRDALTPSLLGRPATHPRIWYT
jgi:urease accessory protein